MFQHDSAHKARHLKNWVYYFRTELVRTDTWNLHLIQHLRDGQTHWLSCSGCMGTNSTILMENLTILHFAATELLIFAVYFCPLFYIKLTKPAIQIFLLCFRKKSDKSILHLFLFSTNTFLWLQNLQPHPQELTSCTTRGWFEFIWPLLWAPNLLFDLILFACFISRICLFQNKFVPYLFALITDKGESCYQCDTMSWYIEWI